MTAADPFQAYGEQVKPTRDRGLTTRKGKPVTDPRLMTDQERKQRDTDVLTKQARAANRAALEQLAAGPFGQRIAVLRQMLRGMTLADQGRLVANLRAEGWFADAPETVRFQILQLCSAAIARARVREGLPPFNDPLPFTDEKPNAYMVIRRGLA